MKGIQNFKNGKKSGKKRNSFVSRIISSALLTALAISLSGCGREAVIREPIADNTPEGSISSQTSNLSVTKKEVVKATKNGEVALENGWYYVVHKEPDTVDKKGNVIEGEEIYYPVVYNLDNYDGDEPDTYVNPYRMAFFTTENETEIPTLFLGQGDKLIYYSTDTLLDYIVWERYYDMKYTIGVWNLQEMTNGRVWLNLDDDDYEYIIPESELYSIYELGVKQVMLDKIGGIPITGDMVDYGILTGATKSRQYDLEVYAGSYYNHYLTTANVRAFRAYELFASVEYETKQGYIYEIAIPEYFVDGFYKVNNTGFVRIITGESYNDTDTNYNERLLYPGTANHTYVTDEMQASIDALLDGRDDEVDWDLIGYPGIYSEYPALNHFTTNLEGKLGYVPEETEEASYEENLLQENEELTPELIEATVKDIDLYFPAKTDCTIRIISPSKETTGDCYVQIGTGIYKLPYDFLMGDYSRELTFKEDTYGTLHITGLFADCQVELIGCTQGSAPATNEAAEKEAAEQEAAETENTEAEQPTDKVESEVSK